MEKRGPWCAFVLCLAAAALLVPGPVGAEETTAQAGYGEEAMLFQEIPSVFGASKYEQKVTEAPSSVSIITSSEIKKYGYRTLADILRSVRGFYITYDRNYSYIGVRGFGRPGDYNSRVLLLVDGHRTNDNVYDQAMVGTEGIIDVDLIDRVEVIRGPGSSLYGSNAFFAVINVITKRGRDLKGAELSGAAGSFNATTGRATFGDRYQNGLEAIISGTGYDSKGVPRLYYGEYNDPSTNDGNADYTDYDRSGSFFTKASYRDFTFEGAYSSRTKGIPTGSFGTDFNDPGNKTDDTRGYLDLKYEHDLGGQADLTARAYFDYYRYAGNYLYDGVANVDLGSGNWWGSEIKYSTKLFESHRLIAGAEFQDNIRQDQLNYDADPYFLYLDDRRDSQVWAAYLQDEFTITRNMLVNAGVRYDHYDTFGGTTNPRLAFIYSPLEKSTFKLLYGSAFRSPNDYELYYASPSSDPPMVSNPDLKPEKIKTYEFVYEQYLGDGLRMTADGYYYRINDLIDQTTDDAGNSVFSNVEEVDARGVELELDNKWSNGVDGRVSYTLQRAEDKETGQPLSNSPEQMAKLNLTVPLVKDKVFAGIEEQYLSRRMSLGGDYAGGFALTNLTLFTQRIINRLELSASLYNLFDKKYGDPVSTDLAQNILAQDGRTYRVKLTFAF
jgi:outer membrane receptor for ferrienterochelin and colicin